MTSPEVALRNQEPTRPECLAVARATPEQFVRWLTATMPDISIYATIGAIEALELVQTRLAEDVVLAVLADERTSVREAAIAVADHHHMTPRVRTALHRIAEQDASSILRKDALDVLSAGT